MRAAHTGIGDKAALKRLDAPFSFVPQKSQMLRRNPTTLSGALASVKATRCL
jgi:hypothetical protein